jgi:hypothetical protein
MLKRRGDVAMLRWTKASYSEEQIQDKGYITTLTPAFSVGSYNVFHTHDGISVVVFSNQPVLLHVAMDCQGSLVAVRYVKEDNNKYSYKVKNPANGEEITVYTLAKMAIVAPGTIEEPWNTNADDGGLTLFPL